MLISQHNALLGNEKTLTGMIGTIDQQCDILAVCEDAFSAASIICDRYLVRVATILNLLICNDHRSSIEIHKTFGFNRPRQHLLSIRFLNWPSPFVKDS